MHEQQACVYVCVCVSRHLRSRVGKWAMPLGAWWTWLLFPALPEEYRSAMTFGIWHKPDVGTQSKDF